MKEKGTISIHTENIFPIIKKFLYADHDIFLRELVSNAVDATQKIKRLALSGHYKDNVDQVKVEVSFNEKDKTITISDQGIGMTAEEIKKYINQIAFSGATEFMEKFKEAKDANEIIGRFGLGFYSAFMVAEKVEIQTLSWQEGAQPARWVCDGSTDFEISEGNRTERGTDVILHISKEHEEFLNEYKLRQILDKHCKFLPVPIKFGTRTEQVPDGEDQDGKPKYKSVEVDDIINNTNPIWVKAPSDLKDEDYKAFYKELYPFSDEPLFWIHLNVDYPFTLTGILYFPRVKKEMDLQRNKIQLYSRQVFITDEVKDIVPEFLMLLHGVIDSPDIPLNVSRSYLQADSNVKKINTYITKKVADKLSELFKSDRNSYQEKWKDIGLFVKYGMISEEKFYEKAKDFALLQNTAHEYFTIEEYRNKIQDIQKHKNGTLVYLYSNDPQQHDTYIQAILKKGYDVLIMDSPIDNHFINLLEQKQEKSVFKRVDADVIQKLIEKDEQYDDVLTDAQKERLKEIFQKTIDKPMMEISIEANHPEELPVVVTADEFTRRMKEMAKMSGGGMDFYGSMPETYKVAINGNHKMIHKILELNDESQQSLLARQAYDLALLSRGMLTGADLTAFVNRSVSLA
jgi:molecular chaperone HtpG